MQLSRTLVQWYFRAAWFVTLPAACLAAAFVVGYPDRLASAVFLPLAFIAAHSLLATWSMCRFESPAAAFLYTRGFTHDQLWAHPILAHLLSVLAVWGPASLCVWLGVRSSFQDHVLQNPLYPLLKTSDFIVPLWWLGLYGLLVGIVEYGPIRRAQPTLDRDAGYSMEFGLMVLLLMGVDVPARSTWYFAFVLTAFAVASVALLVGSWRLHRQIEIQP
jgi:hypothetical protein